jgi:tetratricopeptide (TPR) repeat protein
VIKINPNNAEALNRLGYSLILKKQKLDLAERFLKKAVQISPQDGAIQDSWGWYHYVKGNLSVALKALEKAHQLIPKEPTILEHLADTYSRLHLVDKAMKFYLEAEQYVVDRKTKKKLLDKVEFLLKKKDTPGKKELRLSSEK